MSSHAALFYAFASLLSLPFPGERPNSPLHRTRRRLLARRPSRLVPRDAARRAAGAQRRRAGEWSYVRRIECPGPSPAIQSNHMRTITAIDWECTIGGSIEDALTACIPRSWDENLITERILVNLRSCFSAVTIAEPQIRVGWPMRIEWDLFKLKGHLERDRGDLAVVVTRRFADGCVAEGA